MKVTNVRGTIDALQEGCSVLFTRDEASDSYIRNAASVIKRDTDKVFRVNYTKGIGTRVTRIA